MKVLFLHDVRPTARAGDIKEVKNGFARNYLIPQKLAVLATKHELERAEGLRKEAEERRKREAAEWTEVIESIKETPIKIIVRTGPTGRLYGSVTTSMIASALSELTNREVDRRSIRMTTPIRMLGKYSIEAKLSEAVDTTLNVQIEPDEDSIKRIEEAKKIKKESDVLDPTFNEALSQDIGGDDKTEESKPAGNSSEAPEKSTSDTKN